MKNRSHFRKDGKILSLDQLNAYVFYGFDIDEQDSQGNTHLMLFAKDGDLEGINLFCSAGANIEIKNNLGQKAIDLAFIRFKDFPSENNKKIFDAIAEKVSVDNKPGNENSKLKL